MKVLADRVMAFDRGERDHRGELIIHTTKIGFCDLPDWVVSHPYFKMGVADKIIRTVGDVSDSEAVLKESEKLAVIREEIRAAKKELATLNAPKSSNSPIGRKGPRNPASAIEEPPSAEDSIVS